MSYQELMGAPLWLDVLLVALVAVLICVLVFANPNK